MIFSLASVLSSPFPHREEHPFDWSAMIRHCHLSPSSPFRQDLSRYSKRDAGTASHCPAENVAVGVKSSEGGAPPHV
jgi:hypothetical protein